MKKLFTLIAAMVMVVSANAQSYIIAEGETITADTKITSVDGVTLTFGEKAKAAGKAVANWADADFVAYVAGSKDPKPNTGTEAPTSGWYMKFELTKAGSITAGIQPNAAKKLVLSDGSAVLTDYTYNLPAAKGGESQTLGTNNDIENSVGTKSNGTITWKVEANKTYYLFQAGSKMGFFGFKFEATDPGDPTGISAVKPAKVADGAIFNLAGQRVGKAYKGVVIANGKKYIQK